MSDAPNELETLRGEVERLRALHDATERRLRASHAVARVLSEATSVETAMPRILAALGTSLGCSLADFWIPQDGQLVLAAAWAAEGVGVAWEELSRKHRFTSGDGVPGRVWKAIGPVWVNDLDEACPPRRDALTAAGVRTGFGFPVIADHELGGVIALFTTAHEPPDDQLVEVLRGIGGHLGQFVQHVAAKHQLERDVAERQRMIRASELFSQRLEVDAILDQLSRLAVPWLGDWAQIHLVEPDGGLRFHTLLHVDPAKGKRLAELEQQAAHGTAEPSPVRAAATTRQTQFVIEVTDEDLTAVATAPRYRELLRTLQLASYAAVPIIARGDLIGVFSVATGDGRRLSEDDVGLVEELANRAALAIANARLYEAATATAHELDIERQTLAKLNDVGRTISAELDPQQLLQAVIDVATELSGAQLGAFFYTVTNDQGDTDLRYVMSGPSDAFAKLGMPRNTQLLHPTLVAKTVVRLADVTQDPRFGKNPPHRGLPAGHPAVRSYLAVPVISRAGQVLGGMLFGHADAGVFTDRAQRLVVSLAAHAATGIDNARLFNDQQRLIRELEKTNAELDQFAYAASHDLRAPLRGITNLASWIEEDLGGGTPKKVREHIALLKGRASRMDKLINGLLELARVGRTRQKAERVDVTELLHETIDLLSAPEASRILIIGAMPMMVAERFAMQQVFLNLIGNAIQHAGRKDVVVRITAIERPDDVEFTVADNGVGIAAEHHDRVWQIFQTLSARDVVESTGIGLTIVKKQVESNGGRAWIDTTTTVGATLRFTWPKKGVSSSGR